jgi:hypothetical protein
MANSFSANRVSAYSLWWLSTISIGFPEMGLIGLLWFKAVSIYKQPDDGVVQDFRL